MCNSGKMNNIKTCRSCMKTSGDMKSVNDLYSTGILIIDAFYTITSLQQNSPGNSDLPTHICLSCFCKLRRSFRFIMKCRKSDKKFRNPVPQEANIVKHEMDADEATIKMKIKHKFKLPIDNQVSEIQKSSQTIENEIGGSNKSPDTNPLVLKSSDEVLSSLPVKSTDDKNPVVDLDTSKNKIIIKKKHKAIKGAPTTDIEKRMQSMQNKLIELTEKLADLKHFRCVDCHKAFHRPHTSIKHMSHKAKKEFRCPICKVKFKNSGMLELHMYKHTVRTDENINLCQQSGHEVIGCIKCGKKFCDQLLLNRHMQTHQPCMACQKKLAIQSDINRTSIVPIFVPPCSDCSKSLICEPNSTIHMCSRIKERPHKCKICKNTYKTVQSLNHHLHKHAVHTAEKPHLRASVCTICNKTIHNRTHLLRHMHKHIKKELISCPVCNKSFTSQIDLNEHVKSHAQIVPNVDDAV